MPVVNADSGVGSLQDLIAKVNAAPGKFWYGTGGAGAAGHCAMEPFTMNAGIEPGRRMPRLKLAAALLQSMPDPVPTPACHGRDARRDCPYRPCSQKPIHSRCRSQAGDNP
jgi:hypothetical protein